MSESEQPKTPSSDGDARDASSWRRRLLHPGSWIVITFICSQIVEKVFSFVSPGSIVRLREMNTALNAGVAAVQPWHSVALFWQSLTTNWPQDLSPIAIPFFLLGRAVGGGFQAILLPLAGGPETAFPALVGYCIGFYITWSVCDRLNREVDPLTGILGTLFLGGLSLMLLQPLMLLATGIFGLVLGTVGGGIGVLASIPIPLGMEFAKHYASSQAEARLEAALKGKPAPVVPAAAMPKPPGAAEEPGAPAASDTTEKSPRPRSLAIFVALWLLSWAFSFGCLLFGVDRRYPAPVYILFFFGFLMLYLASRVESRGNRSMKAK